MESLVEAVESQINRPVAAILLEVGQLSCVAPQALRGCFDACTQGTRLEGAVLSIVEIPARLLCLACGLEQASADGLPLCACGSADVRWVAGAELRVRSVELR